MWNLNNDNFFQTTIQRYSSTKVFNFFYLKKTNNLTHRNYTLAKFDIIFLYTSIPSKYTPAFKYSLWSCNFGIVLCCAENPIAEIFNWKWEVSVRIQIELIEIVQHCAWEKIIGIIKQKSFSWKRTLRMNRLSEPPTIILGLTSNPLKMKWFFLSL